MNSHKAVESFRIGSVKEHELPSRIEGMPFSEEQLQLLLENCPAIVVDPQAEQDSLPFTPTTTDEHSGYHLQQPSSEHRRSFEIVTPNHDQPWTDEYGNLYNALTLKGNNFSNPGIIESATASEGFIAYGLQESSVIGRVLKASEVLRSRNITTEHTIGLAEPKQYPWPTLDSQTDAYEMISLKEYKQRIIDNYWQALSDDERTPEMLAELYSKFQDMTFYVSLRATDTAYRLYDMLNLETRQETFEYINRHNASADKGEPLNAKVPEDLQRYLAQVFSPRVGQNFARLHVDLAHRFPHGYNMSALGSIVDLDSIHGKPLGFDDNEITYEDRVKDLAQVISAIDAVGRSNVTNDHALGAIYVFLDSYITETISLQPNISSALVHLEQIFNTMVTEVRNGKASLGIKDPDAIFRFFNEKLYSVIKKVVPQEDLQDIHNQANAHIRDIVCSDVIDEMVSTTLSAHIELYVAEIIDEYINEITMAVNDHETFDIYADLETNISLPSSRIGGIMIEQALVRYYAEIEERLEEVIQRIVKDEEPVSILKQVYMVSFRRTLDSYSDDLQAIAAVKVQNFLPSLKETIATASAFSTAESILDDHSSYLYTGLNSAHFWRCVEEVGLEDVINHLESTDEPVRIEPLVFDEGRASTVLLPVHQSTVRIDEIISDAVMDGWSHTEQDDQLVMNMDYVSPPTYQLIVKTTDDNQRQLCLQLPAESVRMIESGALSLRRLLPTYIQSPLF